MSVQRLGNLARDCSPDKLRLSCRAGLEVFLRRLRVAFERPRERRWKSFHGAGGAEVAVERGLAATQRIQVIKSPA